MPKHGPGNSEIPETKSQTISTICCWCFIGVVKLKVFKNIQRWQASQGYRVDCGVVSLAVVSLVTLRTTAWTTTWVYTELGYSAT